MFIRLATGLSDISAKLRILASPKWLWSDIKFRESGACVLYLTSSFAIELFDGVLIQKFSVVLLLPLSFFFFFGWV